LSLLFPVRWANEFNFCRAIAVTTKTFEIL
jgi:hypothetical protein